MKVSLEEGQTKAANRSIISRTQLQLEHHFASADMPNPFKEVQVGHHFKPADMPNPFKRVQAGNYFTSADMPNPFKNATFDKKQLASFGWFDHTNYTVVKKGPRGLPNNGICQIFADAIIEWIKTFRYPKLPERRMFYRLDDFVLVADWGNFVPTKFPGNRPNSVGSIWVINDGGVESEKMFRWIRKRLQFSRREWQAGLLLCPLLSMMLRYEISYVYDNWNDPPANHLKEKYYWSEMKEKRFFATLEPQSKPAEPEDSRCYFGLSNDGYCFSTGPPPPGASVLPPPGTPRPPLPPRAIN